MKGLIQIFNKWQSGLVFLTLLCIKIESYSQPLHCNDSLVVHHFYDKNDPYSGPQLYECIDEKGITVWFSRFITKDVCLTGECKLISLMLFWDGVGNYLRFEVPEMEPLTKSDHTEFLSHDYAKLDLILHDKTSILENLTQEELIIPNDVSNFEVDGVTAATKPSISSYVVKDAVYTCHTLWHTVYGPSQDEILKILQSRVDKDYLRQLFYSEKPDYIIWAINTVRKFPEYHKGFDQNIIQNLTSKNTNIAQSALDYFDKEMLKDTAIQRQIIEIAFDLDVYILNQFIYKLIGQERINEKVVITLLNMFLDNKIGLWSYNYILRLIDEEHLNNNEEILKVLKILTNHDNMQVQQLTRRVIDRFLQE